MTGGVLIGIGTGIGVLWLGLQVRNEFECLLTRSGAGEAGTALP